MGKSIVLTNFTSIVDQLFQKMEPNVLYVFCQCDVTSLAHLYNWMVLLTYRRFFIDIHIKTSYPYSPLYFLMVLKFLVTRKIYVL